MYIVLSFSKAVPVPSIGAVDGVKGVQNPMSLRACRYHAPYDNARIESKTRRRVDPRLRARLFALNAVTGRATCKGTESSILGCGMVV